MSAVPYHCSKVSIPYFSKLSYHFAFFEILKFKWQHCRWMAYSILKKTSSNHLLPKKNKNIDDIHNYDKLRNNELQSLSYAIALFDLSSHKRNRHHKRNKNNKNNMIANALHYAVACRHNVTNLQVQQLMAKQLKYTVVNCELSLLYVLVAYVAKLVKSFVFDQ